MATLSSLAEAAARIEERQDLHPWANQGDITEFSLEKWVMARLAGHQKALAQMLEVLGPRTVANTLAPYDKAVAELYLAGAQAGLMDSVASEKSVRDKAQEMSRKISEAATLLSLNRAAYDALASVSLDGASDVTVHYLKKTLLGYRLAGVDKDEATRTRLKELQDKATLLSLEFGRHVQEHGNTVMVTDASELAGLPEDFLAKHPVNDSGVIVLTTDFPDYQPVMTYASSHALRLRMLAAYNTRAYPENKQVLLDLLAIREEIAHLLGFRAWADLATADQMMGSASAVRDFLAQLESASREGAQREYELVLNFARKADPSLNSIDIASRAYWSEQYRRSAYAFDSQSVRPYFPYEQVEKGVLDTAARLFRVEFRPAPQLPSWHAAVTRYEVYDSGRLIGRFYLDMHPREGKDKWFSASPVVPGISGIQLPEAALICNFPGGSLTVDGKPSTDPGLMQYSDVVTFFHEFGHLMHAILGGHTEWAGVSGFATEGDFIEAPSQMLEEFFRSADLLTAFARHYQTGETLPRSTIEAMNRSSAFGRADWVRSQLFYTTYSLDLHDQPIAGLDLDAELKRLYTSLQPYTWVDGNRMYASFTHLVGYSSNYYTYALDKVIALDFFAQFNPQDLLGGDAAERYRRLVLEQGGSRPAVDMVKDFLGRAQNMDAFQAWLVEGVNPQS